MSQVMISVNDVSKLYKLYDNPADRLKETFSLKHKSYHRDFYALNNVSFEIGKGETVGIVGRNGSGKSTLLKMLTGVLNPTSGNIQVNGKISALLELGAGFNMDYTGLENIYLNGTIMNIPKETMDQRLQQILNFADIGDYINQPVRTYSSGMFVRLAFAVAINVEPEILIVDEALAVGDTRFQLKCMDKFLELMEKGTTILFVSHDINMIKRFCNRAIWINQGNLIMDGDTDEVTDRYLDFLKSDDVSVIPEKVEAKEEEPESDDKKLELLEKVDIAEIYSVTMYNEKKKKIDEINHGERVYVKIKYYVNEISIEQPVIGVAIRSIDEEYICGLNTLLDKKRVPWENGINEITLVYNSFNLTGGNYYFDVAIFDQTATVPIDYKSRIKTFFVKMDYIAEGVLVMDHNWK